MYIDKIQEFISNLDKREKAKFENNMRNILGISKIDVKSNDSMIKNINNFVKSGKTSIGNLERFMIAIDQLPGRSTTSILSEKQSIWSQALIKSAAGKLPEKLHNYFEDVYVREEFISVLINLSSLCHEDGINADGYRENLALINKLASLKCNETIH
ncbi:hypothetical protein [Guptibacillus hwajinpoensis]|uniref:hypothetical protein n=1 Tax=Guptibacillus hwajinpoensis TaxID=208199 RepID=UPI0024B3398C|nr:hypothetical protein [Pseudalkalibacillus hwajinpoensis]